MSRAITTQPTAESSGRERGGKPCSALNRNVSQNEQWTSLASGGVLMAYGLMKKGGTSWLSLLAGAALVFRGSTGHCALYQKLGINTADQEGGVRAKHGEKTRRSIHVNAEPQEVYDRWRKLENLPSVMGHLESVEPLDDKRSRWVAQGPLGKQLTWEAEIITDRPGEVIAWQSLPGSQVDTAGSVHFRRSSAGKGTEVEVSLKYDPPGGSAAISLANLFGMGLEHELAEDLRKFKQLIEAGEVATAARHPER